MAIDFNTESESNTVEPEIDISDIDIEQVTDEPNDEADIETTGISPLVTLPAEHNGIPTMFMIAFHSDVSVQYVYEDDYEGDRVRRVDLSSGDLLMAYPDEDGYVDTSVVSRARYMHLMPLNQDELPEGVKYIKVKPIHVDLAPFPFGGEQVAGSNAVGINRSTPAGAPNQIEVMAEDDIISLYPSPENEAPKEPFHTQFDQLNADIIDHAYVPDNELTSYWVKVRVSPQRDEVAEQLRAISYEIDVLTVQLTEHNADVETITDEISALTSELEAINANIEYFEGWVPHYVTQPLGTQN